jgi:hypothetical protein
MVVDGELKCALTITGAGEYHFRIVIKTHNHIGLVDELLGDGTAVDGLVETKVFTFALKDGGVAFEDTGLGSLFTTEKDWELGYGT